MAADTPTLSNPERLLNQMHFARQASQHETYRLRSLSLILTQQEPSKGSVDTMGDLNGPLPPLPHDYEQIMNSLVREREGYIAKKVSGRALSKEELGTLRYLEWQINQLEVREFAGGFDHLNVIKSEYRVLADLVTQVSDFVQKNLP